MKLIRIEDLKPLGESRRRSQQIVIWTNGVFDLLHTGHVRSLQAARKHGDCLVVGINSDASVRRLKPGRPILPERDRAEMLAALACVDYVVIFSSPDPCECLELLRPDVLCKGAEYRDRVVSGAELVLGYGGRVEMLPMVAGASTTEVIERCKRTCEF